ncbi:MAG TPA: VOC family protein [Acidimicrobiia bacterium]|nr:VOC family protein [Acidimicrobiia bacterium]
MDSQETAATDEVADRIQSALTSRDPSGLEPLLVDDARWGSCVGRNQVIERMSGVSRSVDLDVDQVVAYSDRIVLALRPSNQREALHQVVFVRDGRIVELRGVADAEEALTATPSPPPPPAPDVVSGITGMATILPVRDLQAALDHYRALGFRVSPYDDGYGYAVRGTADLHLALRPGLDPRQNASAVYLYVDDAEALFAEWRAAGVQGEFFEPHDTEYGLREGAHIDRDGNLLKFGSRLQE